MTIVPATDPHHFDAFRRLNEAWITTLFEMEPEDERLLGNPQEAILAPGGVVWVLLDGEAVVGTVALLHEGAGCYELIKMTVAEAYRGRGWGAQLVQTAIDGAQQRGARMLYLITERSLEDAIHLYTKAGFVEVPFKGTLCAARCDVKMEFRGVLS